jgi:small subunit ribosomal protein S17
MTGKKQSKGIGIVVENMPTKTCQDKHCVFHGDLKVRGRQFEGIVKKVSAQKSAVVQWDRLFYIPKFERFEKRRTIIKVHVPECITVKEGEKVSLVECRPISKTKHFVIVGVLKH